LKFLTKISALFGLASMLVGGCSKPANSTEAAPQSAPSPPPPEYPILVIDEEHQIHGTNNAPYEISARLGVGIDATNFHFAHGANMPPAYQISATAGIRIDATKFHFRDDTNQFNPNMVQLFGNDSLYKLSRETETNFYTLDYYKLETVGGDSFRGFKPGDRITLAIGRSTNTFANHEFWVMWVGQIEVK
jgi:hypothetical protein